jgi:acetoin utilization deacetylase AcuC-like enzyme
MLEDVLLVHEREYIDDLLSYRHTHRTYTSELPISKEIIDSYFLATGGTVLACRLAVEHGRALNLTGGFHHCFAAKAEGFCYLHDFAIGIRCVECEGKIHRTVVIDCDLHQGNGTAVIFSEDPDVFTFSIHQENLYPLKQHSDLDIGLDDFDGDEVYMSHLKREVPKILDNHLPDFVVYEAGADPFEGDQLGTLQLSKDCLFERDCYVLRECGKRGIPVAGVLGGGYAANPEDTVEIHANTCRAFWTA